MKQYVLLLTVVLIAPICTAETEAAGFEVAFTNTQINLHEGGQPLLQYRYAGNTPPYFKPYIRELYTPSGINILRDAPSDHHHHHGMMMAFKVNGVNFWEETVDAGKEQHVAFTGTDISDDMGKRVAGFQEKLEWQAQDGRTLLLEERSIVAVHEEGYRKLGWRSLFQLPAGVEKAKLGGNHYHGLGMRFTEDMDKTAEFLYEGGETGDLVRGDEYLTPGRWCALHAEAEGKPVTVLMYAGEENEWPTLWFTMKTPFSYLSATLNLWKEPLILTGAEKLELVYYVILWDGHKSREDILEFMKNEN